MSDFTQKVINASLLLLEYAATPHVNQTLALALMTVAGKLIDYAIAFDPAPDIAAQAAQLQNSLKQKTDALAVAEHNQPS